MTGKTDVGWNFPGNGYGQETGINDAGMEQFRADPWQALARECIQNSTDARGSYSNEPVMVTFHLVEIPQKSFPGVEQLQEALARCQDYWKPRNDRKTDSFLEDALDCLSQPSIPLLVISDYNTTGLTGSDLPAGGRWMSLVKAAGSSSKSAGSGGSFGIGKNAAFLCSRLRTVFYSTLDEDGKSAFQGVSRLITFENESGEPTQGPGYFGITNRNLPLAGDSVPGIFRRTEQGTDIIVAGMKHHDDLAAAIIVSVIENFFYAIHEKMLEVHVGDVVIDHESLPRLIDDYINTESAHKDLKSYAYYKAMTSSDSILFEEPDFEGLGSLRLWLIEERDFPRRVAMIRSTGMKIFDKGHIQTPLRFAGVLMADGLELNEILRDMEPPAHDKWNPELAQEINKSRARRVHRKMMAWINNCVRELSKQHQGEELDVVGMGAFLPDYIGEPQQGMNQSHSLDRPRPKPVSLEEFRGNRGFLTVQRAEILQGSSQDAAAFGNGESRSRDGMGGIGEYDADAEDGRGAAAAESGRARKRARRINAFERARAYCISPQEGQYQLVLVGRETKRVRVGLRISGESNNFSVPVIHAELTDRSRLADVKLKIERNMICGVPLTAGKPVRLTVTVGETLPYALEVAAFED